MTAILSAFASGLLVGLVLGWVSLVVLIERLSRDPEPEPESEELNS